ncbi:MAG: hypothetical protein SVQ76_01235 [Candidatus Nanohaloarchaea archaeon]|nr:hypothetical protein [Candidatus Nanohaloarchaea archaeon]
MKTENKGLRKGQMIGRGPALIAGIVFIMLLIVLLYVAVKNPISSAMGSVLELIGSAAGKAKSAFMGIDSGGSGSSGSWIPVVYLAWKEIGGWSETGS